MRPYLPFSPIEISFFTCEEVISYLDNLVIGKNNTLVLCSKGRSAQPGLLSWISAKRESENLIWFNKIPENPSLSDVCGTLKILKGIKLDQIVAIGGGSCIDLAKAISALHYLIPSDGLSVETIRKVIKHKEYLSEHSFIDIIALPTTSGTGSEVTKWATIWDMEYKEKLSIDCVQNYPKAAILVPEFTVSMPARLTLSSGLDALSHAMEAFWARSRTPLSQALAIHAINYIREYLPKVLASENNLENRKGMCIASLLAGLAFSITRTTACHSISYPLTMFFGVEHGFAAATTLYAVAERNEAVVPEILQIYTVFGGKNGFKKWLDDVTSDFGALRLSFFGISNADLDLIIEKTFTQGRMDNNPAMLSSADVKDILQYIL